MEKALIEMYLAGACVRRVEDITGALRDRKASLYHQWLNKKAYVHIGDWHNRLLQDGRYSYVYVNRIYLNHIWGGEFEAVHSRSRTGCVGRSGCRISHGAIAPSTLAVVKPMAYGVSVSFLYIVSSLQQPNNTTEKGK